MNKKLDFIKLEKRVLNGGRRYIPRFYRDVNTKHFFKMVYCGIEFFYDAYHNIGPELSLSYDAIASIRSPISTLICILGAVIKVSFFITKEIIAV